MSKYNDNIRMANKIAEKEIEYNKKLNKHITDDEIADIYAKRFNYYYEILNSTPQNFDKRTLIDDSNDKQTLIED